MAQNPKVFKVGGRLIDTLPSPYRVCWQNDEYMGWREEAYDVRNEALDHFIKLKFDDDVRQILVFKLVKEPVISRHITVGYNEWRDIITYDWKEFNKFVNPYK